MNFKQEDSMLTIILQSLSLRSWSKHEYDLMSFFEGTSIWQRLSKHVPILTKFDFEHQRINSIEFMEGAIYALMLFHGVFSSC